MNTVQKMVQREVNSYLRHMDAGGDYFVAKTLSGNVVKKANLNEVIASCLDVFVKSPTLKVTRFDKAGKPVKQIQVKVSELTQRLKEKLKAMTGEYRKSNEKTRAKEAEENKAREERIAAQQESEKGKFAGIKGSRSGRLSKIAERLENRSAERKKYNVPAPARGKKTSETTVLGMKAIQPNTEYRALNAGERRRQEPSETARRQRERELKAQAEIDKQEQARQARYEAFEKKAKENTEFLLNKALNSKNSKDPIWYKISGIKVLDPELKKRKKAAIEHQRELIEEEYRKTHDPDRSLKRSFKQAYLGTKKDPLDPEGRAGKKIEKLEAKKARLNLAKQKRLVEKSRGVAEKIKGASGIDKKKFSVAERNPKARERMSKYVPPESKYQYRGFNKPKTKEQQREETKRMTEEFLKKGGKVRKGNKDSYAMVLRRRRNRRIDSALKRAHRDMYYTYMSAPRRHRDMFPAVLISLVIKLIPIIKMAILSQVGGMIAKRLLDHCMKVISSKGDGTVIEAMGNLIKSDLTAFMTQLKREGSFIYGKAQPIASRILTLKG